MLAYNPKDWFTFIFRVQRADTVRTLSPLILFIACYSGAIAVWELEYLHLSEKSWVKNIPLMHNLLGVVISILLVFRTNTAYDRWWEGRKLWGSLVNNSRNLAMKITAMTDDKTTRSFFCRAIPMYARVLKNHLRAEHTRWTLDINEHPEFSGIDAKKHIPNQVALLMIERAQRMYKENKISGEQLLFINNELQSFTDICGACERIKNTPIPYSYSAFIKKFIFFYVMTLPFGYVFSLGYLVIPIVSFVFYVLASLEIVAEEIEDPFGTDDNDLPMDKIAENIEKHVAEIMALNH